MAKAAIPYLIFPLQFHLVENFIGVGTTDIDCRHGADAIWLASHVPWIIPHSITTCQIVVISRSETVNVNIKVEAKV